MIQVVPSSSRCHIRPGTMVRYAVCTLTDIYLLYTIYTIYPIYTICIRMSLVDVNSTQENIIDHFHCLVDCRDKASAEPVWKVELRMMIVMMMMILMMMMMEGGAHDGPGRGRDLR